jgi:hypothetical protein
MPQNLPKSIADRHAASKPATFEQIKRMEALAEESDRDPQERGELQTAFFVNAVLNAMHSEKLSKGDVAKKMGRTRQYLHQILDEDAPVNFTIETMSSIATAVNRRIEILILADDEIAYVVKTSSARQILKVEHVNLCAVESGCDWDFLQGPRAIPFVIPDDWESEGNAAKNVFGQINTPLQNVAIAAVA